MSNLSDSNPLQLILAIDADELRFDEPVIGVNDTLTSVIFKNLSLKSVQFKPDIAMPMVRSADFVSGMLIFKSRSDRFNASTPQFIILKLGNKTDT